jgi:hypothetical protein
MELSGQLNNLTTFAPGRVFPVAIGWATEPVWTLLKAKNSGPVENGTAIPRSSLWPVLC